MVTAEEKLIQMLVLGGLKLAIISPLKFTLA
jgi:hypothetical protein